MLETLKWGLGTWSFGPNITDKDETYDFIFENGDIYSEQLDDVIPWNAWLNNTALPVDFVTNIDNVVAKKPADKTLILSVSFLNTDRSEIIEGFDGNVPTYSLMSDSIIENAYFKHLDYLINRISPDYMILAMEANDLYTKSPEKWPAYKILMKNIRMRVRMKYPNLKISESMTLHGWYEPEVENAQEYINEIENYINELDFAAISFYPFFKGQSKRKSFQKSFDFLHEHVTKPIGFVETTHLANDLNIDAFDLNIKSNEKEQQEYLETLLNNAYRNDYNFIIWWAHKDFDDLWETFPDDLKDIGKLWRDTGLKDENGKFRKAYDTWKEIYGK